MKIKNCNSLEQVVAEDREGSKDEIAFNSLEVLELEFLPKIKRFCSSNCVLNLPSLEKVIVQQCPRMSIFSVKDASTPILQEILSKEDDEKIYWEGDLNRTINKLFVDMVAFHSFEHLELSEYPELRELWYNHHCSNLKHLVPSSVNFSDLIYLEVEYCHGLLHLITSSTARSLVKLATMKIRNCNSLEQVLIKEREGFEDEIAFESLEILELECLPMIKRFCSSNCVLNLPSLVRVVVNRCPRMSIFSVKDTSSPMLQEILSKEEDEKIYWEGDLNRTINQMFVDMVAFHSFKHLELAAYPELRESCHLTYLEVENCNGLIHLITSSTARSLVKLTGMKIKNCGSLEQVVAKEREGSEDEIASNSLEVLELECLPMMKRFCSSNCVLNLPSLERVVVQQCPRMSIFSVKDTSAPMLQEILSKEEDEKLYWEGDLNRTINKMFVDMVAFRSFKY
ncbi:hypothetical protein K1719_016681 [Acacia pycnantha]|nr:hypothetical protein K1719_016681 [Acacia pycnantha]